MTYFAQNLKHLRKKSSKTQEQLGLDIKLGRTTIANYEAGFSSPTDPEVLIKISHLFQVSIDELLTRDLSVAFAPQPHAPEPLPILNEGFGNAWGVENQPDQVQYDNLFKMNHYMGTPNVIVVDASGEEKVFFVPLERTGEYVNKRNERDFILTLPHYSLPESTGATSRIFEVGDNALEPRILSGDRVVTSWVNNLEEMRNGHVYAIVTRKGEILIRRVINHLPDKNRIQLLSDALQQKDKFPILELSGEEILEAWLVDAVISSQLHQPVENIYGKIAGLESKVQELMKRLDAEQLKP